MGFSQMRMKKYFFESLDFLNDPSFQGVWDEAGNAILSFVSMDPNIDGNIQRRRIALICLKIYLIINQKNLVKNLYNQKVYS